MWVSPTRRKVRLGGDSQIARKRGVKTIQARMSKPLVEKFPMETGRIQMPKKPDRRARNQSLFKKDFSMLIVNILFCKTIFSPSFSYVLPAANHHDQIPEDVTLHESTIFLILFEN